MQLVKLCFVKIFVEVGFQKTQLEGSERLLARAFTTSCSKPFSKTKSFGGVGGDAWVMLRPYLRTVLYYTPRERERERDKREREREREKIQDTLLKRSPISSTNDCDSFIVSSRCDASPNCRLLACWLAYKHLKMFTRIITRIRSCNVQLEDWSLVV